MNYMVGCKNHKSAARLPSTFKKMIGEIRSGYALPFLLTDAMNLPDIEFMSRGVTKQGSMNVGGSKTTRDRKTHDISWPSFALKE